MDGSRPIRLGQRPHDQCDHMDRLFVQYLAIYNHHKYFQSRLKILYATKLTLKSSHRILTSNERALFQNGLVMLKKFCLWHWFLVSPTALNEPDFMLEILFTVSAKSCRKSVVFNNHEHKGCFLWKVYL